MTVQNIIELKTGIQYGAILEALNTIRDMYNNPSELNRCASKEVIQRDKSDKTDIKTTLVRSILGDQLHGIIPGYKSFKLPPFSQEIKDAYFLAKDMTNINIHYWQWKKHFADFAEFGIDEHHEWVNLKILDALFPKLSVISISNVKLTDFMFENMFEYLSDPDIMKYDEPREISIYCINIRNSELSVIEAINKYTMRYSTVRAFMYAHNDEIEPNDWKIVVMRMNSIDFIKGIISTAFDKHSYIISQEMEQEMLALLKNRLSPSSEKSEIKCICICGYYMIKSSGSNLYGHNDNSKICCDICRINGDKDTTFWHCTQEFNEVHPLGYDVCNNCALNSAKITGQKEINGVNCQVQTHFDEWCNKQKDMEIRWKVFAKNKQSFLFRLLCNDGQQYIHLRRVNMIFPHLERLKLQDIPLNLYFIEDIKNHLNNSRLQEIVIDAKYGTLDLVDVVDKYQQKFKLIGWIVYDDGCLCFSKRVKENVKDNLEFVQNKCSVCGGSRNEKKLFICSRCKAPNIRYCSVDCQRKDWLKHKKKCKRHNLSGKRGKQEIDQSVVLNKAIVTEKKIQIAKANTIIRGYCIMENQTEILFHEYILGTLFEYFFGGQSSVGSSSIVYEIGAERMKAIQQNIAAGKKRRKKEAENATKAKTQQQTLEQRERIIYSLSVLQIELSNKNKQNAQRKLTGDASGNNENGNNNENNNNNWNNYNQQNNQNNFNSNQQNNQQNDQQNNQQNNQNGYYCNVPM
eukprot:476000_1